MLPAGGSKVLTWLIFLVHLCFWWVEPVIQNGPIFVISSVYPDEFGEGVRKLTEYRIQSGWDAEWRQGWK